MQEAVLKELSAYEVDTLLVQIRNRGAESPELEKRIFEEVAPKIALRKAAGEEFWSALKAEFATYGPFGIEKQQQAFEAELQKRSTLGFANFILRDLKRLWLLMPVVIFAVAYMAHPFVSHWADGSTKVSFLSVLAIMAIWASFTLFRLGRTFLFSRLKRQLNLGMFVIVFTNFYVIGGSRMLLLADSWLFALLTSMFISFLVWFSRFLIAQKHQLEREFGYKPEAHLAAQG